MVLLSTHNICFDGELTIFILNYSYLETCDFLLEILLPASSTDMHNYWESF